MSDRRPMSQKEKVLYDLKEAGLLGVCAEHWYRGAIPNSRNRIGELRREGHHIASAPCGDDHGPGYARYVLLHGPERSCGRCRQERAGQLALAIT